MSGMADYWVNTWDYSEEQARAPRSPKYRPREKKDSAVPRYYLLPEGRELFDRWCLNLVDFHRQETNFRLWRKRLNEKLLLRFSQFNEPDRSDCLFFYWSIKRFEDRHYNNDRMEGKLIWNLYVILSRYAFDLEREVHRRLRKTEICRVIHHCFDLAGRSLVKSESDKTLRERIKSLYLITQGRHDLVPILNYSEFLERPVDLGEVDLSVSREELISRLSDLYFYVHSFYYNRITIRD